jgi:hypothetical protein
MILRKKIHYPFIEKADFDFTGERLIRIPGQVYQMEEISIQPERLPLPQVLQWKLEDQSQ